MPSILLDTGVWYAFCDPTDGARTPDVIEDIYERVRNHSIVLPWPIVYETLRTRLVRNRIAMQRFESQLKSLRVDRLDDTPYREDALTLSIESSLRRRRPLSLVDCLLRLLIDDRNVQIDSFVTFNVADFSDVCRNRKIELWSGVNE
jgi:predicted nucleic acid-binding protein